MVATRNVSVVSRRHRFRIAMLNNARVVKDGPGPLVENDYVL